MSLSAGILNKVGQRALQMIEDNIRAGVDSDGQRYSYSTRPFAMPARRIKGRKALEAEGRIRTFTTAQGKLWMVVTGGYRDWRIMQGADPDGDFLTMSGRMLRNLQVLPPSEDSVRIGFTDTEQAQKALWLSVTGAGRSRKLWRFMGLQKSQERELAEYAAVLCAEEAIKDATKRLIQSLG